MKKLLLFSAILVLIVTTLNAQTPIGMTDSVITIDGMREAVWDGAPQYVAVDPTTWTPNADHQTLRIVYRQQCSELG